MKIGFLRIHIVQIVENSLDIYKRNNPAADFFCNQCSADYELKSFKSLPKTRIVDGAYDSMVSKIRNNKNPNFLFLQYDISYSVINYFSIPRYFFTPQIIEKRKPLSSNARIANWVGCNILYGNLPKSGIIYLVKEADFKTRYCFRTMAKNRIP